MAIIEIKNVSYKYPLTTECCLKNITLSLEKGKFYGLLGGNGSGKTSICNLIRGFIPHFYQGELEGEVYVNGKEIRESTSGELALQIGYIFQNPFNQISGVKDNVYEEVAYGLENFGVPRDEIVERVDAVMKLTNIEYLKDKNPFELSGGQQQRVALASVIVLEPEILVIDEPTSQLDPHGTEQVFEIIQKMKDKGKTIVLVEHKIDLIAEYVDEIIVLEKGSLYKMGNKEEILSDITLTEHGVTIPQVAILGNQLLQKGIKLPKIPITIQSALELLRPLLY